MSRSVDEPYEGVVGSAADLGQLERGAAIVAQRQCHDAALVERLALVGHEHVIEGEEVERAERLDPVDLVGIGSVHVLADQLTQLDLAEVGGALTTQERIQHAC